MRKQVRIFRVVGSVVPPYGLSESLMQQIYQAAEELGCKPDDLYGQFNTTCCCRDQEGALWVIVEFFLDPAESRRLAEQRSSAPADSAV